MKEKSRMHNCQMKNVNGNQLDKAICEEIKRLDEDSDMFISSLLESSKKLCEKPEGAIIIAQMQAFFKLKIIILFFPLALTFLPRGAIIVFPPSDYRYSDPTEEIESGVLRIDLVCPLCFFQSLKDHRQNHYG